MPRKVARAVWEFTNTGWFWLMAGLWGLAYTVYAIVLVILALYRFIR